MKNYNQNFYSILQFIYMTSKLNILSNYVKYLLRYNITSSTFFIINYIYIFEKIKKYILKTIFMLMSTNKKVPLKN